MRSVVIIDFRKRVDADGDALDRHLKYLDRLEKASKSKLTLIVFQFHFFGRSKKKLNQNIDIYDLHFFSAGKYLKKTKLTETTPALLVTGDPWESMLVARWLRFISKKQLPIQSQLHSSLSNDWFRKNPINFIRRILTPSSLQSSDSIRVSDYKQTVRYSERYGIPEERFFVSAVGLSIRFDSVKIYKEERVSTIGFVGRLQSERGIDLLIDLLRMVALQSSDINTEIFGDGPEAKRIEKFIRNNGLENRITLNGYLSKERHEEIWKKIGVLVSTAETESYGRAIREALVHGVPAISLPTDGVKSLLDVADGKYLWVLEKGVLLDRFIEIARSAIGEKTSDIYLEHFRLQDEVSVDTLIFSWIKLASDISRDRV